VSAVLGFAATPAQLAGAGDVTRLSLHVLAATVWVGGQFVMAGLVPTVRTLGEGATVKVARAFARLTWPAYWLLILTGIWNMAAMGRDASSAWHEAFGIKMAAVLVAGLGSFMHTKASSAKARGIYAGFGTLGSITALVLGIALAG
jgi:putative copper export protein